MYVCKMIAQHFIFLTKVISVIRESMSYATARLAYVLFTTVCTVQAVNYFRGEAMEGGVDGVDGMIGV